MRKIIYDFLDSLKCIYQEEIADYQAIVNECKGKKNSNILFMPSIGSCSGIFNLFDQKAKSANENMIWIIPGGQADFFWLHSLQKQIEKYYESDEMDYSQSSGFYGIEAEEFEECVLLHSDNLQNEPNYSVLGANVILYRLSLASGRETLAFILLDHQDCCWKNIIEEYHITLDWFVDSGRGTEDYFVSVNLYQLMKHTSYPELLPTLYFKGLYNKGEIPAGFRFIYAMLSQPESDGYDKWKTFSGVYTAEWKNRYPL